MITAKPARLWIDLETTHLSPWEGSIIEIAAIITAQDHAELASWESVVAPDSTCAWSDWAITQHSASGLHALCQSARQLGAVLTDLDLWLSTALQGEVVPLAGYSVHFDRSWLDIHARMFGGSQILRHCTHRNHDVSTLLAEVQDTEPDVYEVVHDPHANRPHRAMADCRHALHTARMLRALRRMPR